MHYFCPYCVRYFPILNQASLVIRSGISHSPNPNPFLLSIDGKFECNRYLSCVYKLIITLYVFVCWMLYHFRAFLWHLKLYGFISPNDFRGQKRHPYSVWHPNISSQTGAICLDILKDQWSPALTIKTAMLSLQALMCSPEPNDPQDAVVANMYKDNQPEFQRVARFWTETHARSSGDAAVSVAMVVAVAVGRCTSVCMYVIYIVCVSGKGKTMSSSILFTLAIKYSIEMYFHRSVVGPG